jgi:hypothetical protein
VVSSNFLLPDERGRPGEPVALVGLACRLPKAHDPDAFWAMLRAGRSAITTTPRSRRRLGQREYQAGWLEEVDGFDPGFFSISPREATSIDPQQRLALELGWEAFEDAGVVPGDLRSDQLGVFVGAARDDYSVLSLAAGESAIGPHTMTGVQRSLMANRLSHVLDAHGPSVTVDSGQSSSLVAVHLAVASLQRGESTIALVGGVNLSLLPENAVVAERFGGLSPDGRCFTFDARANGFVPGEGGAFALLMPLSRAMADGIDSYCLIRGSATNNDGTGSGLTVPSAVAQQQALIAALAHTVAHRLSALGRTPDAVILLDTYVPGGAPLAETGTEFLTAMYERGAVPVDSLRLSAYEWIRRLFEDWIPDALDAPTLLVRASEPMKPELRDRNWRTSLPAVSDVADVPGNHYTLMDEHAGSTAAAIQRWLAKAAPSLRAKWVAP